MVDHVFAQPGDDAEDDSLDATKIRLIRESWETAMTLGDTNVGVLLFKNIFAIAPGALELFSFKATKNLYENVKFKSHVKKVVNTVGVAVEYLDDLGELVPILQQQGRDHVPRGVEPEHYPIVGQALLDTLEAGLGDKWTPQLKSAWTTAYKVISDTMIGTNYEGNLAHDAKMAGEKMTTQISKTGTLINPQSEFPVANDMSMALDNSV